MEPRTSELTTVQPGEGRTLWVGPSRVTFKVTGADTEGRYALFETLDPPQSAPPMHLHHREEESYYIVEGEYAIYLADGDPIRAMPGTLITVPRGTIHTYQSVGATAGRMIVVASPAGLEDFFAALGQADTGTGAPPPPSGPPDFAQMAAIAQQYGIDIVGPPPH